MPSGPDGQSGFPGSTSATRTFKGASPRSVKIEADTNVGFEQELSATPQVRQVPRKAGQRTPNPRLSRSVATPQPELTRQLQADPRTFYGGPPLKVRPGDETAGGNPLGRQGGHSVRDTETPVTQRQPQISGGAPGGVPGGSGNVRNTIAERYKAVPGEAHTYMSAPRGDAPAQAVTVDSRFVFAGGGVQTYGMERQMPYTGRGDGARGADLNGQRYYAEGAPEFLNAGTGSYGNARLLGPNHRPTNFSQPAPWSSQYYDTTASVGSDAQSGTDAQVPNLVYVSPQPSRSRNRTGREGR